MIYEHIYAKTYVISFLKIRIYIHFPIAFLSDILSVNIFYKNINIKYLYKKTIVYILVMYFNYENKSIDY